MAVNDLVDRFITVDLAARPASKGNMVSNIPELFDQPCRLPRRAECGGDYPRRRHHQPRHHAGKERIHCGFEQNLSGAMRLPPRGGWSGWRRKRCGKHKPGAARSTSGDIGFAIERHAKQNGYSVVRDYCGHGIGREMHEDPQVLNFGRPAGYALREGMVFTVEPMVNQAPVTSRPRRRVDGRNRRQKALRPIRAYGCSHEKRRRSPDAAPRRDADAGSPVLTILRVFRAERDQKRIMIRRASAGEMLWTSCNIFTIPALTSLLPVRMPRTISAAQACALIFRRRARRSCSFRQRGAMPRSREHRCP